MRSRLALRVGLPRRMCWRLSVAGLCLFAIVVALEHAVHARLSPSHHTVSEYVNTSDGWLMTVGFVAWSLSLALAAVALIGERFAARAGLALAASGVALVAAFPTQAVAGDLPAGDTRTTAGRLHDVGGELIMAGLLISVGTVLLRRDGPLRPGVVKMAVVVAPVLAAVVLLAAGDPAPGWRQRLLIISALLYQGMLLGER